MQIVNFGHFTVASTAGILLFTNEDGQDWYDLRSGLTTWGPRGEFVDAVYGAWAMVDKNGVVTNVEYDPSRLMPGDRTVLGIDADHAAIKEGMIYKGGQLTNPPPPTAEELRADYPQLSPPRFWKAAKAIGITKAAVVEKINEIADSDTRDDMLIDLEECTAFIRLNQTVVSMAVLFNIPPEQLDTLWLWAANTQA